MPLSAAMGLGLGGFLGNIWANERNRSMQYDFGRNSLSWRIGECKKHGIHPLACIGSTTSGGPTIPMQNPLSHLSSVLAATQGSQPDYISEEVRRETLAALRRESQDAKWRNSILIPVTHPDTPGKTWWGFNPRFQMFGSLAQALVVAKNGTEAMQLIMGQATETERAEIRKKMKDFVGGSSKGEDWFGDMVNP